MQMRTATGRVDWVYCSWLHRCFAAQKYCLFCLLSSNNGCECLLRSRIDWDMNHACFQGLFSISSCSHLVSRSYQAESNTYIRFRYANNTPQESRRALVAGIMGEEFVDNVDFLVYLMHVYTVAIANAAGLISTNVFRAQDEPKYLPGG